MYILQGLQLEIMTRNINRNAVNPTINPAMLMTELVLCRARFLMAVLR